MERKVCCARCDYFARNPYFPMTGACMDSAHDGVYEQVRADRPACSVGLGLISGEQPIPSKKFCQGCGFWLDEDEFVYDRTSSDGLSRYCYVCSNTRKKGRR